MLVQQLAAPLQRRRRPRRQAAGALSHAERVPSTGRRRPDRPAGLNGRRDLDAFLPGHADPHSPLYRSAPGESGAQARLYPRPYVRQIHPGERMLGGSPAPRGGRPAIGGFMMGDHARRRGRGRYWLLALTAILACGVIWGITAAASGQLFTVARRREGRAEGRQHAGRRQPQSVHRVLGAGVQGLPPQLRHAHRLQAQWRRRSGDRRQLVEHAGLPHLDVQDPPRHHWQDGVPLTAKDVAFTYNYIIQNNLSAFSTYTVNMKKAVAVDDTTVKFILTKPKANILRMWIPIVPEHIWSKVSGKAARTASRTTRRSSAPGRSRQSSTRSPATRAWSPQGLLEGRAQDRRDRLRELHQPGHHDDGPQGGEPRRGVRRAGSAVQRAQERARDHRPAADQKYLVELASTPTRVRTPRPTPSSRT